VRRYATFFFAVSLSSSWLTAQEAESGFSVPVTVSGDARVTRSSEAGSPTETRGNAGFRFLLSPSVRFNSHWFAYSLIDAQSPDYFGYQTGTYGGQPVSASLMQGYIGYETDLKSASILVKAGRLASAFGLYPLEYDDARTALIEPPLPYTANLPLRPDQLPCSLSSVLYQDYEAGVRFKCNGPAQERQGIIPVTLYGIPGFETQVAWHRADLRIQLTNSSPANPQSLMSRSQFVQWTAGGGYSFHGGLHVELSGFRGPYMEHVLVPLLPPGKRLTDYPASGLGLDATYARGAWSVRGELQRFVFSLPAWPVSPSELAGYLEMKRILSPRVYAAFRTARQQPGRATDSFKYSSTQIAARQKTEELVVGYRFNHLQLLKAGLTYSHRNAASASDEYWQAENGFGAEVQLVLSLDTISRPFHQAAK
jgi:hypothetical protein